MRLDSQQLKRLPSFMVGKSPNLSTNFSNENEDTHTASCYCSAVLTQDVNHLVRVFMGQHLLDIRGTAA